MKLRRQSLFYFISSRKNRRFLRGHTKNRLKRFLCRKTTILAVLRLPQQSLFYKKGLLVAPVFLRGRLKNHIAIFNDFSIVDRTSVPRSKIELFAKSAKFALFTKKAPSKTTRSEALSLTRAQIFSPLPRSSRQGMGKSRVFKNSLLKTLRFARHGSNSDSQI